MTWASARRDRTAFLLGVAGTLAPGCRSAIVDVPGGVFTMGCDEAHADLCDEAADALPAHEVSVSDFRIDRYEVTVEEFLRCPECSVLPIDDEACNYVVVDDVPAPVDGREEHPVNCVTWDEADTYCRWRGGRLPTEAEWEKAARGDDARLYPWGDADPSCDLAVGLGCASSGTAPVGERPDGQSPFGAEDMTGNVYEWVNDWYDADYYAVSPDTDPLGPTQDDSFGLRGMRGGAWDDTVALEAWTFQRAVSFVGYGPDIGFRCAYQ